MEWRELTSLTGGEELVVERVRLARTGVAVEGEFDLPPLAALPMEDQIFVAAFVKAHGSIKRMEALFGVSYPTVKNRLNRIGAALGFADVRADVRSDVRSDVQVGLRAEAGAGVAEGSGDRDGAASETLERLASGEITVNEAVAALRGERPPGRGEPSGRGAASGRGKAPGGGKRPGRGASTRGASGRSPAAGKKGRRRS